MKQLFLTIILALSIGLYGQKTSNKRLHKDIVKTSEGYEVIGTSEPMPNNGVERHMMAVYRALSKYAPRADSIISHYAVVSGNSSNSEIICYIDYTILQNFVDEIGREHVLLRITSGNHFFYYTETTETESNGDSIFIESYKSEYSFSAFNYPMTERYKVITINGYMEYESTVYNIGSFYYEYVPVSNGFNRDIFQKKVEKGLEEYRKKSKEN